MEETSVDAETVRRWLNEAAAAVREQRDYLTQLDAALAGIVELGAAEEGDKTMVDALAPAIRALRAGLDGGGGLNEALADARAAGEEGMRATTPLQASKGRASYLGERSIGHQDPGATSTALIIAALERSVTASP